MMDQISKKISSNLRIYKKDIRTKGLYYSIIHRLYKIPLLKLILTPIVNILKPDYILVENLKLYIDKFDTTVSEKLVLTKVWEPLETKLFEKSINKGDIVLDIGAHIGYYVLIASKRVGHEGKVYAFEPDSKNFKLLQKSVTENGLKNVVLINKAVAQESGEARLYLNRENTGDHRIYDSKDKRESILVKTTTLDDFFKDLMRNVSLIKMDIQGGELRVFKSTLSLIRNNPNIKIFTEFWPLGLKLNHGSGKEYLNLLTKYHFKLFLINEKEKILTQVTVKELLKLFPANSMDYANLYCLRNVSKISS